MRECASGERSVSGRLAQRTGLAGGRHAAGPSGIAHQHDPDRPAPARSPANPQSEHSARAHRCDLRPNTAGGRDVERSSRSEFQRHSPGTRALRAPTDSGGDRADRAPPDRYSDALDFIMTTTPTAMRSAGAASGDNAIGNLQRVFIRTRHGAFLRHPCAVTRTRVRPRRTMRTFVTQRPDPLGRNTMLFSRNGQSTQRSALRTASATTTRPTPCA